ncbi:hypothetical protein [Streptomyces europaeiscabiei]|uniref:hypothetical protein n=1 Tax=Streptomyces europaeiscabiei TaxID=146819 RepID=UPI0038F6CCB2
MTDPGKLTVHDAADLKEIRTSCPELDAVTHHVRDFAAVMRDLRGDQLPAWMERVLADDPMKPLRRPLAGPRGEVEVSAVACGRTAQQVEFDARRAQGAGPGGGPGLGCAGQV